jgi:AraC family transcriptional regulator, regulatory protein of adaptative response / methylphosphotriester-DNA alkyltransferase methyltransferase
MRITELDLSPAARLCLEVADIYEVDRLLEHGTGRLIQRPEFSKGAELYEIVRELHRRGLTFSRPGGHIQGERELEMFRLRAVVGLSLDEIAERFNLSRGRVHQLLRLHFRLDAVPPATRAHRPQATCHRPHTLKDRHRLYLLARVAIKRYYRRPITVEDVAKALASSPRQLHRAYAQFSDSTFREDLTARRMDAAAELLSKPAIPVRDVAHRVGYCQPSHFARAFQRRYGVSPSAFRAESCRAEPHNGTEGQLILIERLHQEYDSCVGRVRTGTADAGFAQVAAMAG